MLEAGRTVLGLALLLGLGWVLMTVTNAARTKATRAVFRKSHRSGQAEVQRVTSFRAPLEPAQVLARVIRVVNAYEEPPRVVAGLFLAHRDESSALFAFGSKLGNSLTMGLVVEPTADGGTTGQLRCLTWSEADGLVSNVDQMQRVRDRLLSALADVGGATLDDVPQPQ